MKITKPIAICLQGTSIEILQQKINLFKNKDWHWASLNKFQVIEDEILSKTNKKLDIVYCASDQRFKEEKNNIDNFMQKSNTLFITNSDINYRYLHKVYNTELYVFDWGYGFSSLFAMLCALGKLGAKRIYLFGADGIKGEKEVYFCQNKIQENFEARANSIIKDTQIMNKIFWDYWNYIGLKEIEIINVNPNSAIICFQKCSIEKILNEN